jgi:DNA topoisomerase IA
LKGTHPPEFTAKLVRKNGEKIEIPDEAAATAILDDLKTAPFVVDKIVKRTTRRNPLPPFITSKLQQEAIRKLRFSAKKTMMVAQQLYEGIDLGPGEPVGLITYMRTDSTRIADEGGPGSPELDLRAVRQELFPRQAAIFQKQEQSPGCPRGHPPDLGASFSGPGETLSVQRSAGLCIP